jgi:hypothetical protein
VGVLAFDKDYGSRLRMRLTWAIVRWSGRWESNPHGQLERLRLLRRQGPRSVVRPGHSAALLTVVDRC